MRQFSEILAVVRHLDIWRSAGSFSHDAKCRAPKNGRVFISSLLFALILESFSFACMISNAKAQTTDLPSSRRLLTEPAINAALQRFNEAIRNGSEVGLADLFQRIKMANPEILVPMGNSSGTYAPLYRVLLPMFHSLPEHLRVQLRATESRRADEELARTRLRKSVRGLVQLIHRYPGTDASIQAHLLIARKHRDYGNYAAMTSWLQPVLHQAVSSDFRASATELLNTRDSGDAKQAETEHNSPRVIPSAVQIPQNLRWQYRPFLPRTSRAEIAGYLSAAAQEAVTTPTTWNAIVEDRLIIRRSMQGIVAIEIDSGESRWHYPLSTSHVDLLTETRSRRQSGRQSGQISGDATDIVSAFGDSITADFFCRDGVLSRVSADSSNVYAISTNAETSTSSEGLRFLPSNTSRKRFVGAELVALEKSTGRRIWTSGNHAFAPEADETPSNVWIFGPPATIANRLYVVFEKEAEICLGCLSQRTGQLLWKTVLALPEQSIDKDDVRRLWSAMPVAAEGMIWAPTTCGWITAVDELTRTVLWASPVGQRQSGVPISPTRRGRQIIITPRTLLQNRWAAQPILRAGSRLLALPQESLEARILDQADGSLIRKIPVQPGSVFLHADPLRFVLGTAEKILCFACEDGNLEWTYALPEKSSIPCGRGAIRRGLLMLPMNNGDVVALRLSDGMPHQIAKSLLSDSNWGDLEPVSDGFLCMAPDRLLFVADEPASQEFRNPLELATALTNSGKWQEALDVLDAQPALAPDRIGVDRLRFRCHIHLARNSTTPDFTVLESLASDRHELAQLRMLKTTALMRQQEYGEAFQQIMQILNDDPREIALTVTEPGFGTPNGETVQADSKQHAKASDLRVLPGMRNTELPLLTWTMQQLNAVFSELSASEQQSAKDSLQELPSKILVRISDPMLRSVLQARIDNEASDEMAWHLLQQSLHLAQFETSPKFSEEVRLFQDRFLSLMSAPATTQSGAVKAFLVNCLALELPAEMRQQLQESGDGLIQSRAELDTRFRQAVNDAWTPWVPQSYVVTPFAQSNSFVRGSQALQPLATEDTFLREFTWSLRSQPARLRAEPFVEGLRPAWSLPGNFNSGNGYASRPDIVFRSGSVLLIQSYHGLSAFSLLDQRLLWSRKFSGTNAGLISHSQVPFSDFRTGQNPPPSRQKTSVFEISSHGPRCLCIRGESKVWIIDLLDGSACWTVPGISRNQHVVSNDQVVMLVGDDGNPVHAARCVDGSGQEVPVNINDVLNRVVMGVNGEFVVWQPANETSESPSLSWINPVSGFVAQRVALTDMEQFHFPDGETLIGVSRNHTLMVVNLTTAEHQVFPLRSPPSQHREIPETPAGTGAGSDVNEPQPESIPLWSPRRLMVQSDPLNYYVMNRPTPPQRLGRSVIGRQLTALEGGVQAIDRRTGQLRWFQDSDNLALATCDQPELPLFLLVEEDSVTGAEPAVSRHLFRGIGKLTGEELFRKPVSSRFELRYLWTTAGNNHDLDVEVYGNHVRVEPAGSQLTISP